MDARPDSPVPQHDVIIVGGGIAGSAAALRAAQYQLRTLWIRGSKLDAKRSRAQWVYNIDNMIGVHDGIVRKKVRKLLRGEEFAAARARLDAAPHLPISTRDIVGNVVERLEEGYADTITMLEASATRAAFSPQGGFAVEADEAVYRAPHLVLATGVMDRQPQILRAGRSGAIQDDIKWIYPAANLEQVLYCIRCEGHLTRGRPAAVIGFSEAAAQIAMMLHERYRSAAVILTNGQVPAWSAETAQLLEAYEIPVALARLTAVEAAPGGLRPIELEDGSRFDVAYGLVALGLYRVYNELAVQLGAELLDPERPVEERHVRINARGETTVPNLYCVGDLAQRADEPVMKQVYTSQEYAVRALDQIDRRIRKAAREAVRAALNK